MKYILFLILFLFFPPIVFCQKNYIVVSKKNYTLCVKNEAGDTLSIYKCGIGKNLGNKEKPGDYKTPEGLFDIVSVEKSKGWIHDFKDGKGMRNGAYGPWFIRLSVPHFRGIGIHGTCFPESIGTRCTEGCVRLTNEDVERLKQQVFIGMKCLIEMD